MYLCKVAPHNYRTVFWVIFAWLNFRAFRQFVEFLNSRIFNFCKENPLLVTIEGET